MEEEKQILEKLTEWLELNSYKLNNGIWWNNRANGDCNEGLTSAELIKKFLEYYKKNYLT